MNLLKRVGLADREGNLSFNKAVTVAFFAQCCVLSSRATFPPWSFLAFEALVLMSGFGIKGVSIWASAKLVAGTVTESANVADVVHAFTDRLSPHSPHGGE